MLALDHFVLRKALLRWDRFSARSARSAACMAAIASSDTAPPMAAFLACSAMASCACPACCALMVHIIGTAGAAATGDGPCCLHVPGGRATGSGFSEAQLEASHWHSDSKSEISDQDGEAVSASETFEAASSSFDFSVAGVRSKA
jgi:hypothetical protein